MRSFGFRRGRVSGSLRDAARRTAPAAMLTRAKRRCVVPLVMTCAGKRPTPSHSRTDAGDEQIGHRSDRKKKKKKSCELKAWQACRQAASGGDLGREIRIGRHFVKENCAVWPTCTVQVLYSSARVLSNASSVQQLAEFYSKMM